MASTVRTDKVGPVSGSADFTLPSADGTAGQFLKTDGSLALGFATVASTGFNTVQFITTSTNPVSLSTGTTKILIEVQGAGGCGAGTDAPGYTGGGGGSGGFSKQFLTVVDSDTFNVTIGAGGTDAVTRDGGDTIFAQVSGSSLGSTITAGGGIGGANPSGANTSGGNGGPITNANSGQKLNLAGQYGQAGADYGFVTGGNSLYGSGGMKQDAGSPQAGEPAWGYGSGGGCGQGSNQPGGDGAPGLVVVWEYK